MKTLILILTLSLAVGCGKMTNAPPPSGSGGDLIGGEPSKPTPPAPPQKPKPPKEDGVTLVLFGAGFCGACKVEFPRLNGMFKQLSAKGKERLDVQLYLISGDPSSVRPTPSLAESYAAHYYPEAKGVPDLPFMGANFKRLLPGSKIVIPAAVVLNAKGEVLKRWPGGQFNNYDIYGYVKAQVE